MRLPAIRETDEAVDPVHRVAKREHVEAHEVIWELGATASDVFIPRRVRDPNSFGQPCAA